MTRNQRILNKNKAQSGQAIVLVAMVMVSLIGVLGLAVDGGGMFLLYRNAQAAVDAGLVSGAFAICSNGDVETTVRRSIGENGFIDNVGGTIVTVNRPPVDGNYANDPNKVQIVIEAEKPSYFINFVYGGPLEVTASGIAGCIPSAMDIYGDNAIFSISASGCSPNSVEVTGADSYVEGGIFSNSDIKINNTELVGELTYVTDMQGQNSTISGTDLNDPDNDAIVDLDAPVVTPLIYDIDDFRPGGQYAVQAEAAGLYTYIANPANNYKTIPTEGLIMVEGDFAVKQGAQNGARGLTIVATGAITFTGETHLDKPYINQLTLFSMLGYVEDDPATVAYEPILNGACNTTAIGFSTPGNTFNGLIYAPGGRAKVSTSTTATPQRGAVIAYAINYSSSAASIIWDPSLIEPGPPSFGIYE